MELSFLGLSSTNMAAQHPEELTSASHSTLFEKHKLRDERGRHNMTPWGVVHHKVNHLLRVYLASTTLRFKKKKKKSKTQETAKLCGLLHEYKLGVSSYLARRNKSNMPYFKLS